VFVAMKRVYTCYIDAVASVCVKAPSCMHNYATDMRLCSERESWVCCRKQTMAELKYLKTNRR